MEKIYKTTVVSKLQHESQQHKAHLIGNQWLDILCSVERLYDTFLYEVEGKQMISRKSTSWDTLGAVRCTGPGLEWEEQVGLESSSPHLFVH